MYLQRFLNFNFRKKLPREFGGERIFVTGRADARILKPGWSGAAFDLRLVVDRIVKPGMTVWDIGANQGILSFFSAFKVGREGAVFALEADSHYADMIFRSSQRLSSQYKQVNVLCAAIAEHSGILELGIARKGHARNQILQQNGPTLEIEAIKQVMAVRGDDLLTCWKKPDFIKMDVEGFELSALRGSEHVLRDARPILYIEVSEEHCVAVTKLLKQFDYNIYKLIADGSEKEIKKCDFYTIARPL